MMLQTRLRRLERATGQREADMAPLVLVVPLFGPDDPLGPPGEYRHTLPDGREYICRCVDVFDQDGGGGSDAALPTETA